MLCLNLYVSDEVLVEVEVSFYIFIWIFYWSCYCFTSPIYIICWSCLFFADVKCACWRWKKILCNSILIMSSVVMTEKLSFTCNAWEFQLNSVITVVCVMMATFGNDKINAMMHCHFDTGVNHVHKIHQHHTNRTTIATRPDLHW